MRAGRARTRSLASARGSGAGRSAAARATADSTHCCHAFCLASAASSIWMAVTWTGALTSCLHIISMICTWRSLTWSSCGCLVQLALIVHLVALHKVSVLWKKRRSTVRIRLGIIKGDQKSIWSAWVESIPSLKIMREGVSRCSSIWGMCTELQAVLCKIEFASYLCVDQACSFRALAESFCYNSAWECLRACEVHD